MALFHFAESIPASKYMAESKLNPLLYLEREMNKRNQCCSTKNIFGALLAI